MTTQLTSKQFGEWIAYQNIEPFGEWRDDLRAGIMASTVANSVRAKGQQAAKPSDFMPEFKKGKKQPEKKNLRQKTIDVMSKLMNVQNVEKNG